MSVFPVTNGNLNTTHACLPEVCLMLHDCKAFVDLVFNVLIFVVKLCYSKSAKSGENTAVA